MVEAKPRTESDYLEASFSTSSSRHPQRFLDGLRCAFLPAWNGLHIEDAKQMISPLRRRHRAPSVRGQRLTLKGGAQNRRDLLFPFHRKHQTLGEAFRAHLSRFRAFSLVHKVSEPLPH